LRRNAAIVLGNCGDTSVLPLLQEVAQDADPIVQAAARWAITRISQRFHVSISTPSGGAAIH
jgi:HEAT repeat protein